jgi:hypothetical protein
MADHAESPTAPQGVVDFRRWPPEAFSWQAWGLKRDGVVSRYAIARNACRPQRGAVAERKRGASVDEDTARIGLDEALEALRGELASALMKEAGEDLQFPIENVTVEFKVAVTRSNDGKARFHLPLVDLKVRGSGAVDGEILHTVTLALGRPVDRAGSPVRVSGWEKGGP